MAVMVEWQGMKELSATLRTLPEAIRADVDEVLAGIAEGMARSVAVQYRHGRTGKLQRGVRVRKLAPLAYQVRSGAPHAHLFEFGTAVRYTKRGAHRGAMPRFGPIFGVEALRFRGHMVRDLTEVLRHGGRGTRSPGGTGLL